MKKRAILLLLVLALGLQVYASATTPWALSVEPQLSFSNSTAYCEVEANETADNSYIVVTMKLWSNNQVLQTWTKSGLDSVTLTGTYPATKGETYTLAATVTVNGISMPTRSTTQTY